MIQIWLVVALAAAVALGCKKSGENESKSSNTNAVRTHMDFNYSYDKKDVFLSDASDDLTEMDQNIIELSGKAAAATAAVQADAQTKIQDLRNQRAELGKRLAILKSATSTNWNDLKSDYQKSDSEIKASLKAAWQWLTDKTRT